MTWIPAMAPPTPVTIVAVVVLLAAAVFMHLFHFSVDYFTLVTGARRRTPAPLSRFSHARN